MLYPVELWVHAVSRVLTGQAVLPSERRLLLSEPSRVKRIFRVSGVGGIRTLDRALNPILA